VLYLENHSFDNVLGFWCNQNPGRCPAGGMPSSVTLSNGAVVTPGTDPDTVPNVNHSVAAQVAAMNGGQMNGWQNIPHGTCSAKTSYRCISGYQPGQIPNLTALAQNFAISDKTFSMANSPSWGGHLYAVTANMDGFLGDNPNPLPGVSPGPGWGCNSNKVTKWVPPAQPSKSPVRVPSCIPDYALQRSFGGAFERTPVPYVPTILDRLSAAKLSWAIYGAPTSQPTASGYIWNICTALAECLYGGQAQSVIDAGNFRPAALLGALPSFSIVTPGGAANEILSSCHNGYSMTACDNWVGQLVSAVENGPAWRSTAIFITFDDCGCFYDQVPPPKAPDGTQEGPRTPLIIVSPYAKPGYTDNRTSSFAGILAFTEHTFGLAPLGPNDSQAYDFSNAFNYAQAPRRPVPMVVRKLPWSARHIRVTPAMLNDAT
jgi:phospholipase C